MKTLRLMTVVTVTFVMSFMLTEATTAEVPRLEIQPNFTEPLVINGTSGGKIPSNCGNIGDTPHQIIQLNQPLPYLRLTVDSPGQSTLLIDGPGGRFCVLADDYSQSQPEITGYWQAGEYSLYVGELSENQYNYTLSIWQQKRSPQ
jgi:hypothetical protein